MNKNYTSTSDKTSMLRLEYLVNNVPAQSIRDRTTQPSANTAEEAEYVLKQGLQLDTAIKPGYE
jgi:hypothetical protein